MKNLLKLEYIALFLLSIFLFNQMHYSWWWFLILILAPDLSMVAYVFGPKIGSVFYNIFHHLALAVLAFCVGWHYRMDWLQLSGIILLGHSSLDRILGYGLKYPDDFKHTHLGWIGKEA